MTAVINSSSYDVSATSDILVHKSFSEDNQVTLFHGDCIEFLNSIPDESLQLIVTSPYNVGKEYESKQPFEDYLNWQDSVIALCIQKLKKTGSICWQVGNYIDKK